MPDTVQFDPENQTVFNTPGGSIATTNTVAGTTFTLSSPNGSNFQFGTDATSALNTGDAQNYTMGSTFSTTNLNSSAYIGKDYELRIAQDSIEMVGPDSLITGGVMEEWQKEYAAGYGGFKSQWPDNRASLTPSDFPLNSLYSMPSGATAAAEVCPTLRGGTLADNAKTPIIDGKTPEQRFDEEMMPPAGSEPSKATKESLKKVQETYGDIINNVKNWYTSKTGQKA